MPGIDEKKRSSSNGRGPTFFPPVPPPPVADLARIFQPLTIHNITIRRMRILYKVALAWGMLTRPVAPRSQKQALPEDIFTLLDELKAGVWGLMTLIYEESDDILGDIDYLLASDLNKKPPTLLVLPRPGRAGHSYVYFLGPGWKDCRVWHIRKGRGAFYAFQTALIKKNSGKTYQCPINALERALSSYKSNINRHQQNEELLLHTVAGIEAVALVRNMRPR